MHYNTPDAWHNINALSASIYHVFPNAPQSHIQATYDHMDLSSPKVSILSLHFYLPAEDLKNPKAQKLVAKKIRSLFMGWQQNNLECLNTVFSEHETWFTGIPIPLKEVRTELACG